MHLPTSLKSHEVAAVRGSSQQHPRQPELAPGAAADEAADLNLAQSAGPATTATAGPSPTPSRSVVAAVSDLLLLPQQPPLPQPQPQQRVDAPGAAPASHEARPVAAQAAAAGGRCLSDAERGVPCPKAPPEARGAVGRASAAIWPPGHSHKGPMALTTLPQCWRRQGCLGRGRGAGDDGAGAGAAMVVATRVLRTFAARARPGWPPS